MNIKHLLFLLAFIEGAAVMTCELVGAKMIAPFFGSSLYVWAAVLGVTLFALMAGYYIGGYLSERVKSSNLIYIILIIASAFLILMPYTSVAIMQQTVDFSVKSGSTISLLVFMFPALLFMGMSSPVIINLINEKVETTGKSAGSIYAISTLGGIISTFFVGFYLLPEFGTNVPCLTFGTGLLVLSVIGLWLNKKKISLVLLLIPILGFMNLSSTHGKRYKQIKLIYESEGILGQIRVYDMPMYTYTRGIKNSRVLMVNNTAQTLIDLDNPGYDIWDWSYYFPTAASIFPKESKALVLGAGGGAFINQFYRLGFDIEVVELDKRIKEIATDLFFVEPSIPIYVDDARRFINNNDKNYDIVFFDVFHNETPPSHVLTKETFEKTLSFLNEDGMIILNFFGYISGDKGLGARSIYKTLTSLGLEVELLPTPGEEGHRNLIFLASRKKLDFTKTYFEEPGMPPITNISANFIDKSNIDFSDGYILRDNQPILEKIYLSAATEWRRISIDYNIKKFMKEGVKL
jgi:predicted membrane-bound spermidine synthase